MLTHAFLIEKYGPLMTDAQVAEVLLLSKGTVKNQRIRGELPIPTVKRGGATLFHAADVAAFVDGLRGVVRRVA